MEMSVKDVANPSGTRAGKYQQRLVKIALGISLLIPLWFSDEALKNSAFAWNFARFVNHFVPAVGHMASVSSHPNLTATLSAVNWVMFPFYFGLALAARPFWNEQFAADFVRRYKEEPRFLRGFAMAWLVMYLLMDWGVIPHGIGMWSMNGAWWFFKVGGLTVFDQYRFGIALFYWAACVYQMVVYTTAICLASIYLSRVLRRWHLLPQH